MKISEARNCGFLVGEDAGQAPLLLGDVDAGREARLDQLRPGEFGADLDAQRLLTDAVGGERLHDRLAAGVVLLGDAVDRLVDLGLGDDQLGVLGFEQLQDLVDQRAQHLLAQALLRRRTLGAARCRQDHADPLVEIVGRDDGAVHDGRGALDALGRGLGRREGERGGEGGGGELQH